MLSSATQFESPEETIPTDCETVFIGGVNWKANEHDLLQFFNAVIGPAYHCRIITDRDTHRSKGYGFITFADAELARRAKEHEPPLIFMGKVLNCQSAYRRLVSPSPVRSSRSIPPPGRMVPSSVVVRSPPPPVYYPQALCYDMNGFVYVVSGWHPHHSQSNPTSYFGPYPSGGLTAGYRPGKGRHYPRGLPGTYADRDQEPPAKVISHDDGVEGLLIDKLDLHDDHSDARSDYIRKE
uniref:RRM domain-containing protein n=1 Tax=Spongospora subterranea TaxID=70186 RepID=A0A0H5R5W6_9EUKA|eukprot:CRZ09545.1 hypothetical protein [Spongospora subterranea]